MPGSEPILKSSIPLARVNMIDLLSRAALRENRSQVAVAIDLLRATFGPRRLTAAEFFQQGGWQGTAKERAACIGLANNLKLNRSLTAKGPLGAWGLMTDKFAVSNYLAAHGIPVPELRAVFATEGNFPGVPRLSNARDLADWLEDGRHLPVFGKPNDGSMSLGAVPVMVGQDGMVDIGGRQVHPAALAHEVASLFPRGWLLQEQLRQPPEIEAMIGPAIGSVRVVTLWEEDGPQVLYAIWRHPAPGIWVDGPISGSPTTGCALDANGAILRAHQGDRITGRELTHSLVTPALRLPGFQLGQWRDIETICRKGHRLFPGHALVGWDVAMTLRGPVVSEVNANPMHLAYQRAFHRGFLHDAHRKRLATARRLMLERARHQRKGGLGE